MVIIAYQFAMSSFIAKVYYKQFISLNSGLNHWFSWGML